ncbi:MAG: hypothetical protein ACK4WM_05575 [Thermoflexales bacterium]
MLTLHLEKDTYAICRMDPKASVEASPWLALMRLADALMAAYPTASAPTDVPIRADWCAFRIELPADAFATQALCEALRPLAEARVEAHLLSMPGAHLILVPEAQRESAITALTRYGHTVRTAPEHVEVKCSWRLPSGERVIAAFLAEVSTYNPAQDRWLMRFVDVRFPQPVDQQAQQLIDAQIGKWAWVPSEARQGFTLPLKYETLTGQARWFYAHDPRAGESEAPNA